MEYAGLTYPPYDAPLAEAYGARFDAVYILLHPFVTVPEELSWQAAGTYPNDEQILRHGAKYSWANVATATGIKTCDRMNQALLTAIRSLSDEMSDFAASSALQSYLTQNPVWMPTEGRFEPLLQSDLLDAFQTAGHNQIVWVPEFPDREPILKLGLAELKDQSIPFPSRGSLVAPDLSFLFTVDWDSFFTLFYGPRSFVTKIVEPRNLEGFFAVPTTEHSWYNYALGCCVVTLAPDGWPSL